MKIFCFVILCVLLSPTMTNELKNKLKCEKTNCSLMDDPVCVKIKNKNRKEVYVVAKDKCEIIYASCQKDVEAAVVPMVNCRQDVQNITSKRNKRDADESSNENFRNDNADGKDTFKIYNNGLDQESLKGQPGDDENEDQEILKGQSGNDENEDQEILKGQSGDDQNEDQEILKGQSGDDENEDQEILKGQSGDDENENQELINGQSGDDENEVQDLLKGQSGDDENEEEELLNGQLGDDENEDQELLNGQSGDDENEDANQNNSELNPNPLNGIEANTTYIDENDIPKMSVDNVGADYDQHNEKVDLDENKKDCPKVCPTRDVMVCAKCQHNIHRTFLSLCHLRMFACKHTSERLQLVKREPCVQSAPFLSRFKETKGRIHVSGELDAVHKFIFCRDKKLLSKDDPRCIVVKEDK